MARAPWWATLLRELAARGLDTTSERGRTVAGWLAVDLRRGPPADWETALPTALDAALALYDVVLRTYETLFLVDGGLGETWVRRGLRGHLGFATDAAVEAVLDRIHNRRRELLGALRRKYQPSFFGPATFKPQGVRGYFRRVAVVEGYKIPFADLRHTTPLRDGLHDRLVPEAADESSPEERARLARQLADYWSPANGFTSAQRLEGLVSLGCGWMTGVPIVEERCRVILMEKLPTWEARGVRLGERLGRLLDCRAEAEAERLQSHDDAERRRLGDVLTALNRDLERLRHRLRRHDAALLPRPGEVQTLLDGVIPQKVGTLRYQRIGHEVAHMERRVLGGAADMRERSPTADLVRDVLAHYAARPPSPSQRGLAEAERTGRRDRLADWRRSADFLLTRVARLLHTLGPPTASSVASPAAWLCDVQDLYELGTLDRVGVLGGLKSRRGWRFDRMLQGSGGSPQ